MRKESWHGLYDDSKAGKSLGPAADTCQTRPYHFSPRQWAVCRRGQPINLSILTCLAEQNLALYRQSLICANWTLLYGRRPGCLQLAARQFIHAMPIVWIRQRIGDLLRRWPVANWSGSSAITRPGAGSGLGRTETRARRGTGSGLYRPVSRLYGNAWLIIAYACHPARNAVTFAGIRGGNERGAIIVSEPLPDLPAG